MVVDAGNGFIYRFPRPHVNFEREMLLLEHLRGRLTADIPVVSWTGTQRSFAVYPKLTGRHLDGPTYGALTEREKNNLALSIADFLASIHTSVSSEVAVRLGIPRYATFPEHVLLLQHLSQIAPTLLPKVGLLLGEMETSWTATVRNEPIVLLHNDFHPDNFVTDASASRLHAVWDFSCVAMGFPSTDFRYLSYISEDLLVRVMTNYRTRTGSAVRPRTALLAHSIERITNDLLLNTDDHVIRSVDIRC